MKNRVMGHPAIGHRRSPGRPLARRGGRGLATLHLAAGVCGGAAFLSASCLDVSHAAIDPAAEERDVFIVTSPAVMDVPDRREYVAEIQSSRHIELRARIGGFLDQILVDEGQTVEEGQAIFVFNSLKLQEELRRATAKMRMAMAEVSSAEIEVRNRTTLTEKKVISSTELDLAHNALDAARARLDEAEADVSEAQLQIQYARVQAPFSGIINRIPNKVGSLLEKGDLLTTLSDNSEVLAYFRVSEREHLDLVGRTDVAHSVTLELVDGRPHAHPGRIDSGEAVVSRDTGAIAFRARFPNPEGILRHGSSAKVILESWTTDALVIPQRSTFEVQHKACVYLLDENNKVTLRSVVPGLRLRDHFVITSGLSPSDRILYEGIQLVKEGELVEADFTPLGDLVPL